VWCLWIAVLVNEDSGLNRRLYLKKNYGIIESLSLEKTSKIIKSNRQPHTTMPAKPCPENNSNFVQAAQCRLCVVPPPTGLMISVIDQLLTVE